MLTSVTTEYDIHFDMLFDIHSHFERYDLLFEMIYDRDDSRFDMPMTFILKAPVSIFPAEER